MSTISIAPYSMSSRPRASGQALAEFLVSMLMLTPFIVVFSTLASYLEIQKNAYEAVRYIAWEETVQSANDVDARQNVLNNFFKHRYNGLAVKRADSQNRFHLDQGAGESLVRNNGDDIRIRRRYLGSINAPTDVRSGAVLNDISFGNNSLVDVRVAVPLAASTTFNRLSDPDKFLMTSPGFQLGDMTYEATGAILGNTWMATSEAQFDRVTRRHSLGGTLNLRNIEWGVTLAQTLRTAMFFLFPGNQNPQLFPANELQSGFASNYDIVPENQSSVLPEERVGP